MNTFTGVQPGPLTRSLALRYLEAALAFDRATPRVGDAYGPLQRIRFVAAGRERIRAAKLLRPLVAVSGGALSVDCYLGPVTFVVETDGSIAVHCQKGVSR